MKLMFVLVGLVAHGVRAVELEVNGNQTEIKTETETKTDTEKAKCKLNFSRILNSFYIIFVAFALFVLYLYFFSFFNLFCRYFQKWGMQKPGPLNYWTIVRKYNHCNHTWVQSKILGVKRFANFLFTLVNIRRLGKLLSKRHFSCFLTYFLNN